MLNLLPSVYNIGVVIEVLSMFILRNEYGRYLLNLLGVNPTWTDIPKNAKRFRELDAQKTQSLLKDMLGIDTELEPLTRKPIT